MSLLTFDLRWLADTDLWWFVPPESSLRELSRAGIGWRPDNWRGGLKGLAKHARMLLRLWHLVVAQHVGLPQAEAGDASTENGNYG